jgi:hypothetical protein
MSGNHTQSTTQSTTQRSIEEILDLRLHAAKLRVLQRNLALVTELDPGRVAAVTAQRREALGHAKRLADEDLVLVQLEIDSQRGLDVEPVTYDPATRFAICRYATVLLDDDPALTPAEAMGQARRDESVRFEDWSALRRTQPRGRPGRGRPGRGRPGRGRPGRGRLESRWGGGGYREPGPRHHRLPPPIDRSGSVTTTVAITTTSPSSRSEFGQHEEVPGLGLRQTGPGAWRIVHIGSGLHLPMVTWPTDDLPCYAAEIALAILTHTGAQSGIDWIRGAGELRARPRPRRPGRP